MVSANAASVGDVLLGVPLNCSAGLNADAVNILQVRKGHHWGWQVGQGRRAGDAPLKCSAGLDVDLLKARGGRCGPGGRKGPGGWRVGQARACRQCMPAACAMPSPIWHCCFAALTNPCAATANYYAYADMQQDAGLWRYAASLTAASLRGTERAQALQRWAHHVLTVEGSLWRAVGILTAAGCLRMAAQALRDAGLADCAHAYIEACHQAGLMVPSQQTQQQQGAGGGTAGAAAERDQSAAGGQGQQLELFDLLGQRGRGARSGRAQLLTPGDEERQVGLEFEQYICLLIAHL